MEPVKKRIQIALSRALLLYPFFQSAIMYLVLKPRKIGKGPMATDQFYRLYYDEELIEALKISDSQLYAIVMHELLHNILLHFKRLSSYDPMIANIAGDLEINQALKELKLDLPDWALLPEKFNLPPKLTAEEYAELLQKMSKSAIIQACKSGRDKGTQQGGSSGGAGKGGEEEDPTFGGSSANGRRQDWEDDPGSGRREGATEHESEAISREILEQVEKSIGSIPGYLKRVLEKAARPKVNWKRLLRVTVSKTLSEVEKGRYDYSRIRPSKKSFDSGVIYPSTVKPKLKVGVLIDTSGSMGNNELSEALGEVLGILKDLRTEVVLFSGDVEVTTQAKLKNTRDIQKVELVGGGGTAMDNCMYQISDLKLKINAFIVITDGYTPWPNENPLSVPVIVVITSNGTTENIPSWIHKVVAIPKE